MKPQPTIFLSWYRWGRASRIMPVPWVRVVDESLVQGLGSGLVGWYALLLVALPRWALNALVWELLFRIPGI
jgi:hypothetical protein